MNETETTQSWIGLIVLLVTGLIGLIFTAVVGLLDVVSNGRLGSWLDTQVTNYLHPEGGDQ